MNYLAQQSSITRVQLPRCRAFPKQKITFCKGDIYSFKFTFVLRAPQYFFLIFVSIFVSKAENNILPRDIYSFKFTFGAGAHVYLWGTAIFFLIFVSIFVSKAENNIYSFKFSTAISIFYICFESKKYYFARGHLWFQVHLWQHLCAQV